MVGVALKAIRLERVLDLIVVAKDDCQDDSKHDVERDRECSEV